jgi:hypothetical protein
MMRSFSTFSSIAFHHFGADIAGADRVHGDAGPRAFLRQRLGEAQVAGLGGGIVGLPRLPLLSVDRRDVDDAAELAVTHARPQRMGHVEQAGQVGVDHLFPLLPGRHLVEHRVAGDAGIVHQHVDRADLGLDLGDAGGAGVIVGDRPFVGRDAGFLGEGGRRLVVAGVVRATL